MSRALSDLQLERYLAEDLSPEERAQVEALLRGSPEDEAALQALRNDAQALFTRLPPAAFAGRLASPRPRTGWRWALAGAAGAFALAALLFVTPTGDDEVRTKGGVAWQVSASGAGAPRRLDEGALVAGGEVLSFEVRSGAPVYVAVVSHAADGWFTYAPTGPDAVALPAGATLLPDGAKLDGLPGDEVLYLLSSSAPFAVEPIKRALQQDPGLGSWNSVTIMRRSLHKQ